MNINRVVLEYFKKIREASIDLSDINILVGGNNSGKSSVLEGIHFSVVASVASRLADTKTFTQESLLFCPTKNFVNLRHKSPYRNQSNFGYLRVYANDEENEYSSNIKIYRGRNEGNVGCELTGSITLRQIINSTEKPFSIYVPGLSGIPQVEEYRTESLIRRGIASGDANLYLRNVLLLIKNNDKLPELINLINFVFPGINIYVRFNPKNDIHIDVRISFEDNHMKKIPLELVGTGVQQALQIFSYIVLFRPFLLLLDEPDSHLHPNNQGLLAKIMLAIASESNTKVISTTHSRHLVDALYDESNIVWLKNGRIFQQGDHVGRIPLLMDIGALDSFEKLRNGQANYVFLTEDANIDLFEKLVRAVGFEDSEYLIYSYKTSSNIQSAILLTDFIIEIAPNTNVIIHRDRDFMTDTEVQWVSNSIEKCGAVPFITEGCDIESYFVAPSHLAKLMHVSIDTIIEWQNDLAIQEHNTLTHKFTRKRDEAKKLYRKYPDYTPPSTLELIGNETPLPDEKRLGKYMIRKIRSTMNERFNFTVDISNYTEHLYSEKLNQIKNQNV